MVEKSKKQNILHEIYSLTTSLYNRQSDTVSALLALILNAFTLLILLMSEELIQVVTKINLLIKANETNMIKELV